MIVQEAKPDHSKEFAIGFVAIQAECRAIFSLCESALSGPKEAFETLMALVESKALHTAQIAMLAMAKTKDDQ